nr:MAG TPA: hypothetical protein [Caudoviricetes sp.]
MAIGGLGALIAQIGDPCFGMARDNHLTGKPGTV